MDAAHVYLAAHVDPIMNHMLKDLVLNQPDDVGLAMITFLRQIESGDQMAASVDRSCNRLAERRDRVYVARKISPLLVQLLDRVIKARPTQNIEAFLIHQLEDILIINQEHQPHGLLSSSQNKEQSGEENKADGVEDDSPILGLEDLLSWKSEKKVSAFRAMRQILNSLDDALAQILDASGKYGVVFFTNSTAGLLGCLAPDGRYSNLEATERIPYLLPNISADTLYFAIPALSSDPVEEVNLLNLVVATEIMKKFSHLKIVLAATMPCFIEARGKKLYEIFDLLKGMIKQKNKPEKEKDFAWLTSCLQVVAVVEDELGHEDKKINQEILNEIYKKTFFATEGNSNAELPVLEFSFDLNQGSLQQLLDKLTFTNCSELEFSPSFMPGDFSYFANTLGEKLRVELKTSLKRKQFDKVKDMITLVADFDARFHGNPKVSFVLKDLVLQPITSHFMALNQAFRHSCLPSHQWTEKKITTCFEDIKSFQESLADFQSEEIFVPEDLEKLSEQISQSKEWQRIFKENRDEQEDAVVKALLDVKGHFDKLQAETTMLKGEKDIESRIKKAEEEINKLNTVDEKRYRKILNQFQDDLRKQEQQKRDYYDKLKTKKTMAGQASAVGPENGAGTSPKKELGHPEGDHLEKMERLRKDIGGITDSTCAKYRLKVLKRCIDLAKDKAKNAEAKKMVVVLGDTGAGKSTLINLLCGKNIIKNKEGHFEVEGSEAVAKIGHGATSETLFPDFISGVDDQLYCDCPGFFDTRGIEPNLGNAISLCEAFKGASQIQVIILMSYHTLKSVLLNEKKPDAVLESCIQLFGSKENLMKNVDKLMLGVSHVPPKVDLDNLMNSIDNEVLQSLSQNTFVNNPIDESLHAEVNNRLSTLPCIETKELQFKVCIAPNDIQGLISIITELMEEFKRQIKGKKYTEASKSAEDFTSVIGLLQTDIAQNLAKSFKEVGHTFIEPLIKELEESYENKSKKAEDIMKERKRIFKAIMPEDKYTKLTEIYDQRMKELEIKKFRQHARQSDEDAENLMDKGDAEIKSLAKLFSMTNGRKWIDNTNWIVDEKNASQWKGVSCNENKRITKIELPGNHLSGMLFEDKADPLFKPFEFLEELDLSTNDLYGELPSSLYELKNLKRVNLKGNLQLCGPAPPEHLKKVIDVEQTLIGKNAINIDFSPFGFYVVPKEKILLLDRFIPHEQALEKKMLALLANSEKFCEWTVKHMDDDKQAQEVKVARDELMFLSHRWRGPQGVPHPDCDKDSKLKQVQNLLQKEEFQNVKFIWMDYLCVPQDKENKEMQMRAIQSLPHYVKCCDHFVVLSCDESIHKEGTFDVYKSRGWCRLERLSAMIPVTNDLQQNIITTIKHHHTDGNEDKLDVLESSKIDPKEISPVHGNFFDRNDIFDVISLFPTINEAIQNISQDEDLKSASQHIVVDAQKYLEEIYMFETQLAQLFFEAKQNKLSGGDESNFTAFPMMNALEEESIPKMDDDFLSNLREIITKDYSNSNNECT